MKRVSTHILLLLGLLLTLKAMAQPSKIIIPDCKDRYCEYVRTLESGNTKIDYLDFRNSFLKSSSPGRGTAYDSLEKLLRTDVDKENYTGIIKLTQAMLSLDYTSMLAHMYLQKAYKAIGDTLNSKKYHDIEFGLISSILKSGDGKTCETGWHVIQIDEEYFIINVVLGVKFSGQRLVHNKKNSCDLMETKTESGKVEN